MSGLENYVTLANGVPKSLRFSSLTFDTRDITDPLTKQPKKARALVGYVIQEDGIRVTKTFSTLSDKLARVLSAYASDARLQERTFRITRRGAGFSTEYEVTVA